MPEAMDPSSLELKSQEVVSCHVWLLGTKLVSSAGVLQALSTNSVPNASIFKNCMCMCFIKNLTQINIKIVLYKQEHKVKW